MNLSTRRDFLSTSGRLALWGGLVPALGGALSGCKTLDSLVDIGVEVGHLSPEQAAALRRTTQAVARSFEEITPEQEYYLGRSVGAMVLDRYPAFDRPAANRYLNLLGQSLVQVSDRPETFGGYHFLLLDSAEINAFATPGGFIFISRGMLRCCAHEDALAAVLAHEIGHVQQRHGLQAIQRSRLTSALGIIAVEGTKAMGREELLRLVKDFEDSIADITSTLIQNGYSRAFERQADQDALRILARRGYQPHAMVDLLQAMKGRLRPGGLDFARTHPGPENRLKEIGEALGPYRPLVPFAGRASRFAALLAEVG